MVLITICVIVCSVVLTVLGTAVYNHFHSDQETIRNQQEIIDALTEKNKALKRTQYPQDRT